MTQQIGEIADAALPLSLLGALMAQGLTDEELDEIVPMMHKRYLDSHRAAEGIDGWVLDQ